MSKERLNIGFLVDDLDMDFTAPIITGALLAASELDVNLYLFPGKYLSPDYLDKKMTAFNYQFNTIFSYADKLNLDAICILLGTIASTRTLEEKRSFLKSLGDIPIITLCSSVDSYPSINFNNTAGFYDEIEHLIVAHRAYNIGFVGGPVTNSDSIEREQVFLEVMKKHNLPVSPSQIVHGNFTPSCTNVVEKLLDENDSIDAIVFANDYMALAGYEVLNNRGLVVGKDILIVGFDDSPFSPTLDPPLTTVKPNGTDLGYKAILACAGYAKAGSCQSSLVNSSMILRKSCGCTAPNGSILVKRMGISGFTDDCYEQNRQNIINYLFGEHFLTSVEAALLREFSTFLDTLFRKNTVTESFEDSIQLVYKAFADLFKHNILTYTTSDRIFDMLHVSHHILEKNVTTEEEHIILSDLFYLLYRTMSEQIIISEVKDNNEIEQLHRRLNSFTIEAISYDDTLELSYSTIAEVLNGMNMKSCFLYTFKEPKKHTEQDKWHAPDSVCLRVYHTPEGIVYVPSEEQEIPLSSILENKFTKSDKRITRILAPLFSNEMQYGLLLCELDQKYHSFLIPSILKISTALRSLSIFEQQRKVETELETSLQVAIENNEYLTNISMFDELSKIYNRRGFYTQIQSILTNPSVQGQRATLLFGDLDGLKKINDQYGHDAGDLAIKTVAQIMTEAFSASGVVARFGGDEFAALLIMPQMEYEQTLLPCFTHIKMAANDRLHTPYKVDMSIGCTEFIIHKDVVLSELLEQADAKLYLEKQRKKTMRTD